MGRSLFLLFTHTAGHLGISPTSRRWPRCIFRSPISARHPSPRGRIPLLHMQHLHHPSRPRNHHRRSKHIDPPKPTPLLLHLNRSARPWLHRKCPLRACGHRRWGSGSILQLHRQARRRWQGRGRQMERPAVPRGLGIPAKVCDFRRWGRGAREFRVHD